MSAAEQISGYGLSATDAIYLEPGVLTALVQFATEVREAPRG